jgi:putative glutamine amidotransferase
MTKIAIIGKSVTDDTFGIHTHYVKYFGHLGTVAILPPALVSAFQELADFFDIVVMPGGADVNPANYGEMPTVDTGKSDPILEYFDRVNLGTALNRCLVVGICRGFQSLMVEFNHKLTQEIEAFHPRSNGWYDTAHEVQVYSHGDKPFKYEVNSLHHQGVVVQPSELAAWRSAPDPLVHVLAADVKSSSIRYVVEAAESLSWLGVQWHPEAMDDPLVLNWIRTRLSGKMVTE